MPPPGVIGRNAHANHLLAQGDTEGAIALYRAAIAEAPGTAALHFNLANALSATDPAQAEAEYHAALALDPAYPAAHANFGTLLRRLGRPAEALEHYRHAMFLAPRDAAARYNLGTALLDLGRTAEALTYFRQATTLIPPHPPAFASTGEALLRLGQRAAAHPWFEAALAQSPEDDGARLGLAVCQLAAGDFLPGWANFEARLTNARALVSLPTLEGTHLRPEHLATIAGRHVVVMAEQGYGDSLQFVRYVPLLRVQGATVTILAPPPLVPLLTGLAEAVTPKEHPPAPFDFICPMLSLPWVFATTVETIPANTPYLAATPSPPTPSPNLRVGLAWSGNPAHLMDAERSLPLATLAPLLAVEGVEFHALHNVFRPADLPLPATIIRHDDALPDFATTAALIARMDLVISVDTAVAHLAGALARPLWLLLAEQPDFRWLEARDDTPWYPTARLHRRTAEGWPPLIARLARHLAAAAAFHRGNTLWTAHHRDEAIAAYTAAIAADPCHADAHTHLGNALLAQDRTQDAIAAYRAGIASNPGRAPLHYNLANALMADDNIEAAEPEFRAALALAPSHAGAHNNLGNALRAQSRLDEALASYQAALALRPDYAGTLNNIGATLIALHRPDEAEPLLGRALALQPAYAEAANNLGGALLALDRPREALAAFEAAVTAEPAMAPARFGAALAHLAEGDFRQGWRDYESRWDDPRFTADTPPFTTPIWSGGGNLAGQHLLLHAEQGLGDTIQFARYAPLLRQRGAHVTLWVQAPLATLLAPLADETIAQSETPATDPIPPHDLRCPLLSLPHALGTRLATIPATIPYLHPDAARIATWRHRLGRPTALRIGIAFSGSADHPDDALRSLPAATLIAALPGAELHVVQKDIRPPDAATLATHPAIHRHDPTDFADTAALLACLDLIVTVDTSIAHLAGALGLPVWVLLQYAADFRWLRARSDSPWYPTARLFRQTTRGDWTAPLTALTATLASLP